MTLTGKIKAEALRLGFSGAGVVEARTTRTHEFYSRWIEAGYAGEMDYLRRHEPIKRDPRRVEPAARSLIALTHNYNPPASTPPAGLRGRISRYARGTDYHTLLRNKLRLLAAFIDAEAGRTVTHRIAVDTVPLMEREFAAAAGLGWVGKNANLIHWEQGSWLFLAELLVDIELDYDRPRPPPEHPWSPSGAAPEPGALTLMDSCGSCTACIDACPTSAIVADKTVDSRRCISYLTIELKGAIPTEWRSGIGDWVFGCDICQEVCPWNGEASVTAESAFRGDDDRAAPSLPALLALDEPGFRRAFRNTTIQRTRRRGLLRNAAIALGNLLAGRVPGRNPLTGEERTDALAALERTLADHEPVLRGAAAWALAQDPTGAPGTALMRALKSESDPSVREELHTALS